MFARKKNTIILVFLPHRNYLGLPDTPFTTTPQVQSDSGNEVFY